MKTTNPLFEGIGLITLVKLNIFKLRSLACWSNYDKIYTKDKTHVSYLKILLSQVGDK